MTHQRLSFGSKVVLVVFLAAAIFLEAAPVTAQTESVIHTFTLGSKTDGTYPWSSLLYSAGVFYGTTRGGGAHNRGTVYQMSPPTSKGGPWREKLIFSFGSTTGQEPSGALLLNATTGKIYGTTLGTSMISKSQEETEVS